MRVRIACVVMVGCVCCLAGCKSNELNRSHAETILDDYAKKSPINNLTVSFTQIGQMTQLGKEYADVLNKLMSFVGSKPCITDKSDIRLAMGQLVLCQGYVPPDVTWQRPGAVAKLAKPVVWKIVEVTGITEDPKAPGDKIVEYTWKYDLGDWPKPVADIINPTPPNQGKALLRRYDDGWRFVDFAN